MSRIVCLNGKFVNENEATISPDDRGFIFADGVYEVTKYYKGKPFRFNDHITRFKRSLNELGIVYNQIEKLSDISQKLLELNGLQNEHAGVYWQITRGANKRVHHFPKDIEPTFYAFAYSMPSDIEKQEKGISTILRDDIR